MRTDATSDTVTPLFAVREVEEKEGVCWRVDEHEAPSKPKLQATRSSGLSQSKLSRPKSHPNLTVPHTPFPGYCKKEAGRENGKVS